eukprot:2775675-Prymnesium_polylepis.1
MDVFATLAALHLEATLNGHLLSCVMPRYVCFVRNDCKMKKGHLGRERVPNCAALSAARRDAPLQRARSMRP